MGNKMLIDAAHPEETRVVVVRGNRVEEFDYESAIRKQLRGNIYLAKVTRVEPSLQAAFVDYGGNRHGFLAFSEIHPDYYQIPVADRAALLEEEAEEQSRARAAEDAEEEDGAKRGGSKTRGRRRGGNGRRRNSKNKNKQTDKDSSQGSRSIAAMESPYVEIITAEVSEQAISDEDPVKLDEETSSRKATAEFNYLTTWDARRNGKRLLMPSPVRTTTTKTRMWTKKTKRTARKKKMGP